jgi:Domain of unknown function (DUF6456)
MPRETRTLRFVRALAGNPATREGDCYVLANGLSAGAREVLALIADGAIAGDAHACRANAETRGWIKRKLLEADAFAAQHRQDAVRPDSSIVNLAESPLARLAAGGPGSPPFLERHHVEAGERVRRLVERAHIQPRVTMTYAASMTAGQRRSGPGDISDMAADARKALDEIHQVLPRDCAGVVMDVCGLLKGLQVVEAERGWPRRSAKLVLRIGLDQLAQHFGYAPVAVGVETRRARKWMGEGARPSVFE